MKEAIISIYLQPVEPSELIGDGVGKCGIVFLLRGSGHLYHTFYTFEPGAHQLGETHRAVRTQISASASETN